MTCQRYGCDNASTNEYCSQECEIKAAKPSSEESILRGAEKVWGQAAGQGGVVTSNLPQKNPQHTK